MKMTIILSITSMLIVGFKSADLNSSFITPPAEIIFHWEDHFNNKEKDKITLWLNKTALAAQQTLGNYPFDIHFYIHRSDNANEPVPWGNTERSEIQGVTFHVNPEFSIEEFLNDWTAPHEISHLAIPFPGKSNRWFSEGFATYMQGQILIKMGEFTTAEIETKYKKKLSNCWTYYQSDSPFIAVADSLKSNHHYAEMYWGSVTYFANLNQHLKQTQDLSLNELLQEYQTCCRLNDENLSDIIRSFDQLTNNSYSSDLLDAYQNGPAREIMPAMD